MARKTQMSLMTARNYLKRVFANEIECNDNDLKWMLMRTIEDAYEARRFTVNVRDRLFEWMNRVCVK